MLVRASGLLSSPQALTVQLASGLRWVECTESDCKHTQAGVGNMLSAATEGTMTQKGTFTKDGHNVADALGSNCSVPRDCNGNDRVLTQVGWQKIGLQQVLALPEQRMGTAWRLPVMVQHG